MSTSRSSETQGDPDEARRFSVLVVSDRDEERDQLERIVDAAGLDVEGCSSSAAQAMLAANGPDVALLCVECDDPDLLANSRRLRPETPMLVAGSKIDVCKLTEFTLGAYVNYECPRSVADRFLAQLASEVCQHVAKEGELVRFQDVDRFVDALGPEANVLRNSDVVAMPCSFDGECMAVLFLFRDAEEPFEDDLAATLDSIRQIFAEQLTTVVRVHHRMEAEWPPEAADDQEEGNDWGFGEGPLAA